MGLFPVKPGKVRQLNYAGQLSVDDAHHVITGACASISGSKDSMIFSEIMDQTIDNLHQNNMGIDQVLADAGYSSGESLQKTITSMLISPILVNTNPNGQALILTKKKTNTNA